MTIATNGYGINDHNDQVIIVGDKDFDFFLFSSQFEPTIEELMAGEIRADEEDDEEDDEEELGGYFIPDPDFEQEQPASILQPIPIKPNPIQQPTLKFELSINLNISINGDSIFSNQLGCSGLDSNLGAKG